MEELFTSPEVHSDHWIPEENRRKQQLAAGKKCHMCDAIFLRDAEKMLTGEISQILDISLEQAKEYLEQKLQ